MNYEKLDNNKLFLTGELESEPIFSHEVCSEGFYLSKLKVKRLSNQIDLIPITISERLISQHKIKVGDTITIEGQFRSYNRSQGEKSKLCLSAFVREICNPDEINVINNIEIEGFICKEPNYRVTPLKREICDILVAVNRSYNKSDYIPCIIWGRNAKYVSSLKVGTKLKLSGRVQSRTYQKTKQDGTVEERTAYEISVNKIKVLEEESDNTNDDKSIE